MRVLPAAILTDVAAVSIVAIIGMFLAAVVIPTGVVVSGSMVLSKSPGKPVTAVRISAGYPGETVIAISGVGCGYARRKRQRQGREEEDRQGCSHECRRLDERIGVLCAEDLNFFATGSRFNGHHGKSMGDAGGVRLRRRTGNRGGPEPGHRTRKSTPWLSKRREGTPDL